MFLLHRHYRKSKSFKGLQKLIVRATNVDNVPCPRMIVVFSRESEDAEKENMDLQAPLQHGNQRREEVIQQPYYRTNPDVLHPDEDTGCCWLYNLDD